MAKALKTTQLQPDADAPGAPRIAGMSQVGYTGLKVIQKQILEEVEPKWRMPMRIKTIDEMRKDASVSAALQFYTIMLARVPWTVKAPIGATPKQKERAKAISTMMDDMEHSWFSFIVSLLSCVTYGFSVHEKVYKKRLPGNSKFSDGITGWKCFPSRSQSTLYGWEFSEDGRKLTAFLQTLQNIQYSERYSNIVQTGVPIRIPREKFMLFRTSPVNDNPEGSASLKAAYVAWRYKKTIEEQEMIGIGRELSGLFNIGIPARYMSPDASAADKAVYEEFKKVARNVAQGEQSGVVYPSDHDPETKTPMFKVDLLSSNGSSSYDTSKIIQRYNSAVLVSLFADLLQLGNDATGSFALAGAKADTVEYALNFRLKEIRDVLNTELIPQTFAMNGWSDTDYPTFEFGSLNTPDLESVSKFLQRTASTNTIEIDRELLNYSRNVLGLESKPEDEAPNIPETMTSRSSDGMSKGAGNGTSDKVAGTDSSSINQDNKG